MKQKNIVFVVLAILLTACSPSTGIQAAKVGVAVAEVSKENGRSEANKITYAADEKTGLCFAVIGSSTENPSITTVPCSPEVLAQAKAKP